MQVDEQADKQVETSTEISNIAGDTQSNFAKKQTSTMKNALEPKRSNKFLIPAIALALAALGVSIWFVIGRFSNNPAPTASPATNSTGGKEQPKAISAKAVTAKELPKAATPPAVRRRIVALEGRSLRKRH